MGSQIVAPTKEGESQAGLRQALLTPELFNGILTYFDTKLIPREDLFKNTLKKEFNVDPDDVETCFNVMIENLRDYGLIQTIKGVDRLKLSQLSETPVEVDISESDPGETGEGTEEGETEVPEIHEQKKQEKTDKPRQIFVAHGKNKKPLQQLKAILTQFHVPFQVAIDEPHKGRVNAG